MEIYAPHNDYNLRDLFAALRIKQWIKNLIIPAVGFAMLDASSSNANEIANIFFGLLHSVSRHLASTFSMTLWMHLKIGHIPSNVKGQ